MFSYKLVKTEMNIVTDKLKTNEMLFVIAHCLISRRKFNVDPAK